MNRVHKIRLIDNSYDLEIAEQLLGRFISQKIAFIEDRIKETDPNHKDELNQLKLRIDDLKAEKRSLNLFIEEFDKENIEMEIGCTIVMSAKNIESK